MVPQLDTQRQRLIRDHCARCEIAGFFEDIHGIRIQEILAEQRGFPGIRGKTTAPLLGAAGCNGRVGFVQCQHRKEEAMRGIWLAFAAMAPLCVAGTDVDAAGDAATSAQ
jgi:hypothetical protein